jgi:hypothetical protein
MQSEAILKYAVALSLGGVFVICVSCFPVITNLSKGESVPETVATHVPEESELLVLPLWTGPESLIFRDPYLVPASALGTSEANVPKRIALYLETWPCGGPDQFVLGYLVVTSTGTFVWSSDKLYQEAAADDSVLRLELSELIAGHEAGPHLREFIRFQTDTIEFAAPDQSRLVAQRFLNRLPEPE